jgi:hypothetical protein
MEYQTLILSLIKDDLTNARLVSGLNDLGLDAGKYYLHLSETIFSLVGLEDIEHNEEVWEEYFRMIGKGSQIDHSQNPDQMENLAAEILLTLQKIKDSKVRM